MTYGSFALLVHKVLPALPFVEMKTPTVPTIRFFWLFLSTSLLQVPVWGKEATSETGAPTVLPSEIPPQSQGAFHGKPSLRAVYVEEGPKLDGHLDDEVWKRAMPAGDLVQTFPDDNTSGSQPTEFRILYDKENLYLGVWCFQEDPRDVTANAGNVDDAVADDYFILMLDTFHDRRNAYAFAATPNSLRLDMLVGDQGRTQNLAWDTIWRAKCAIHDWGWAAELAIPFKSIAFDEKSTTWGINFVRSIKKNNETQVWANARPGIDPANAAEAGTLSGLKDLKQGLGLDVLPFVTGTYVDDRTSGTDDFDLDGGLDVRYRINARTTAYLSVNTDFADVEADTRQFNFSRFNQSFPEKRDFFLEDAGMFDFPSDGISPYYSRKIGLSSSGEIIPIHFAAKVTSHQNGYNFGLMDVLLDAPEGERNVFVGRVRKNLENGSTLGLISTIGNPRSDSDGFSLGTDYQFVNGEFMGEYSLATKVWALGSSNDEQENAEFKIAYGADTLFSSRELTLAAAYSEVSDHFNPPLGYVERDDYRKYYLFTSYEPRYEDLDWLMASFHQYELELYTDTGNSLSDITHTFTPFTLIFGAGDSISYEITRKSDRPDEAFTIFDTSLQAGKYDGTYHTISLDTDPKEKSTDPWDTPGVICMRREKDTKQALISC